MIKVIYILHEDEKFGAPRALMDILVPLKHAGVYPIVLTHSKGNVYKFCKKNQIKVIATGHLNIVCGPKNKFFSYLKFIPKLLLNFIHDELAYLKIKNEINLNEIDFIHSNVSILSLGAKLKKKCHNAKYIVHLREPASITQDYLFVKGNLIKYLTKNTDYFIGISNNNCRQWIKSGISRKRITTIYDGVVLPKQKNFKASYNAKALKAIVVGSFSTRKNQLLIIDAVNNLPETIRKKLHVAFVGSGESYESIMKERIKKYKLTDNFSFLGYCDNLPELYDQFDIGIISSIGESFGRVTIEYMAHGLLTLVSNSGANNELVINKKSGLVFDVENSKALSNMLTDVVSNFDSYKSIREQGQQRAYSNFTAEASAKNLLNFYKNNK